MLLFDHPDETRNTSALASTSAAHAPHDAHQAALTLPSQEASVPASRHFAEDLLSRWGVGEDECDSAALIVDELASNAVQHGHALMTLLLALDADELLITLADSGAVVRHEHGHADLAADEHGRGTGIVEFLALWTEVHDNDDGREVRVAMRVTCGALH
ncbi:ATP-binding protein [Streptomyces sp. NPDC050636]|uniref:ATP-binding protein n=1 Tax=Streptomyces sp. NPDC050636 TaxID=3154510 RepID=UPI00342C4353